MIAIIVIFVVLWAWIINEIINAPLMDNYGNIIEEDDNIKKK
jgi:hypothetical protein